MNRKTRVLSLSSLLMIISLIISIPTQAQERKQQGPPPIPNDQQIEKMVNELAKTLSLSTEQKEQVSEKYYKHFKEVKAKVEKARPKKEEMEILKSDFEKDIKSILDEKQQEQFDDYMKKIQKPKRK